MSDEAKKNNPTSECLEGIKSALAEEGLIAGDEFAAAVLRHPKLHEMHMDGNRPLPFDRDTLGRMVREAWVRWALTQPEPKASWLAPYDELAEPDKEADRQIGEAIARWTLIGDAARASRLIGVRRTNEGRQSFIYDNGVEMPYKAAD